MSTPMTSVEREIRSFLYERLVVDSGGELHEDRDLVDGGYLDSLSLMHLIDHIEERFRIQVTPEEFDPQNFRTVGRICAFVEKKISGAPL